MIRLAALLALATACQPRTGKRPPPAVEQLALLDLAGEWRWLHRTDEDGTSRVESETWDLRPAEHGGLSGRYLRTVEVRSLDGVPFPCNQRTWYVQRALFDVVVTATASGFVADETAYDVQPSPCDHGFRRTSRYTVVPRGSRIDLEWPGGSQTLWQVRGDRGAIGDEAPLPTGSWQTSKPHVDGTWRWHTRAYDDDDNVRDEWETWDITARTDTEIDGTYRRRVRVTSANGAPIACAAAPSWSFEDVYVFDGVREDTVWHLRERGVGAGDHACMRTTPDRTLDEAMAEQIGDFLVLEWRGKRRQVLHR